MLRFSEGHTKISRPLWQCGVVKGSCFEARAWPTKSAATLIWSHKRSGYPNVQTFNQHLASGCNGLLIGILRGKLQCPLQVRDTMERGLPADSAVSSSVARAFGRSLFAPISSLLHDYVASVSSLPCSFSLQCSIFHQSVLLTASGREE